MPWAVAQNKAGCDHIASRNLQRQNFEIFNPLLTVRRIIRNKLVHVQEQVFSGYIFILLEPSQRWTPINSTMGILRLITRKGAGFYDEPRYLPDDFVPGLQRRCRVDDDRRKEKWILAPGTLVRVINGPLISREGIVTWSNSERVKLLLSVLDRSVKVELHPGDVMVVDAAPVV
jgi:transcriptional antiterminator RfaH